MNIITFPEELVWNVFSFLSAKEVCTAGRVCKYWHAISRDDGLWRLLTQEAELPFASSNDITPYDNYRFRIRPFSLISDIGNGKISPLIISIKELIKKEWPTCKRPILKDYKGNYLIIRDHYSTELPIIDLANPYTDKVKVQTWDINACNLVLTRLDDFHILFRQGELHKILDVRIGKWIAPRKLENSDSSCCTNGDTIYFINEKENSIERWNWKKDETAPFFDLKNNLLGIDLSQHRIDRLFSNNKLLVAYLMFERTKGDRFLIWKLNEINKRPALSCTFKKHHIVPFLLKIRGDYLIFTCDASKTLQIFHINKLDSLIDVDLSFYKIQSKSQFEFMKNQHLIIALEKSLIMIDLKNSKKHLSITTQEQLKLKKIGIYLRGISPSGNIYKIDYENGSMVKQKDKLGYGIQFGTSTITSYLPDNQISIWGMNPLEIKKD